MNTKEINWINAAKALCIIFVFLRHCSGYYGGNLYGTNSLFLPFYVNAFFFVSGYLLLGKQLSAPKIDESTKVYISKSGSGIALAKNILYRIVIPSTIFALLEYVPKKIIKGDAIDVESFFFETAGGLTYWFTSALVVAELLFLLLLLTRIKNIWFYAFAALFLISVGKHVVDSGFNFIDSHGSFPWQWKHGLFCTIFMAAGGVYWKYEPYIRKVMKGWLILLMVVAYIIISVRYSNYLYDGYMISMLLIHPVGVLWGIVASVLLIEVCRRLPKNKILTFIGQNSIGFYFLSGALPMTFGIVCKKLPIAPNTAILLAIWLITLALAYVIVSLLHRYTPWIFDLRSLMKQK